MKKTRDGVMTFQEYLDARCKWFGHDWETEDPQAWRSLMVLSEPPAALTAPKPNRCGRCGAERKSLAQMAMILVHGQGR